MNEPKEVWFVESRVAGDDWALEEWFIEHRNADEACADWNVKDRPEYEYRVRRYVPAPEPSAEDLLRLQQERG